MYSTAQLENCIAYGAAGYNPTLRGLLPSTLLIRSPGTDMPMCSTTHLSYVDPTGLYCAYLNDAGNGVESIDDSGGSGECGSNGGYWIEGNYGGGSWVNVNSESGLVTGAGYDSSGNLEYSIAGAMGSNTWGAWTQTFSSGSSLISGLSLPNQLAANNGTTPSTGCPVSGSCGPTARTHGFGHCSVTVNQNGKYTTYDGGPTGSIYNSTLQVQSGPGGPPGPNTFYISNSCTMAGCVPQVAQQINNANMWYSFPFQNSNTAASMMLNQCGANVSLPVWGPQ